MKKHTKKKLSKLAVWFLMLQVMLLAPLASVMGAPLDEPDTWYPMGSGMDSRVNAITVEGMNLYAGGAFNDAGGVANADRIARWDGSDWHALGVSTTVGEVNTMLVSGHKVYAGGTFLNMGGMDKADYLAYWDGVTWNAPWPEALRNSVHALAEFGGKICIGGGPFDASGIDYLACWDGFAWNPVGGGVNGYVYAMAVSDGNLFVAGDFTIAGGTFVNFIARWDGSHWYALGPGLQWRAFALAVSGTNVYAGGQFLQAGVTPSNRIARWDGTSWYALGAGTNGIVKTLAIEGPNLYVGGGFTNAGGVADTQYIARWDGSHWHAVGGGLNNDVETIASGSLYVGGSFTDAGGVVAADRIARLGNPPPPLPATGFAPGIHSAIPSPIVSYTNYAELTLEIPKLGVHSQIVGVPQTENEWKVDWLGDRIGWLQGTAFPTWAGNTALTAHVYGANGLPGTFVDLGRLRWGDEIVIHAWGQRHVYEVRYNYLVRPRNTHPLRHEAYDWVTLITCSWFDERLGSYAYRRVVRAVLMDVTE